ncbi:MAG: hypothetical protein H6P98_11 [Candidatus Aminicenantes bacterium]|nr:hypothetical protein [Candidatus Aminicenantes bacterium]
MRKNSRAVLGLVLLLAACRGGGDTYRKMRLEIPAYSPFQAQEFEQAVFGGFLVVKEPEGFDLNKEIIDYMSPEFERRLQFQVAVRPIALEGDEVFRNTDFWKSQSAGEGRSLFVTGKAELTRETRKSVLGRPKPDIDDPEPQERGIVERALFVFNLHLYLIRGDTGEIVLDREFKETKAYPNTQQRADFAFYDLVQRVKTKLFRPGLSEDRLQERYLLVK